MPDLPDDPLFSKRDPPNEAGDWEELLCGAFADPHHRDAFLPLAEQAVRARPGDALILYLAATAALLDGRTERALVFLKRLSKRYVPTNIDHLLQALALAQQNRLGPARAQLERHGLTRWHEAMAAFPGGWGRSAWLSDHLDTIMGRRRPAARQRVTTRGDKATSKARPADWPRKAPASAPADSAAPFEIEFDLAPLLVATRSQPRSDGRWYRLRERFSHLSLAQGSDELLCLPHLRGIETLAHQVETVRKVLQRFRGRVLLADEVGLGKTIEAGMVLKEYLLRGMAERALVLVPALLVGQWREELENKVGIA